MAVTQITHLIVKPEFAARVLQLSTEKSALFQSGIIANDPAIGALAKAEGATFSLPFWNDISGSSGVGSDDPATSLTPGNIDMGKEIAIKMFRAGAWSAMDITKSYSGGDDPLERIAGLIAGSRITGNRMAQVNLNIELFGVNRTDNTKWWCMNRWSARARIWILPRPNFSSRISAAPSSRRPDNPGRITSSR